MPQTQSNNLDAGQQHCIVTEAFIDCAADLQSLSQI